MTLRQKPARETSALRFFRSFLPVLVFIQILALVIVYPMMKTDNDDDVSGGLQIERRDMDTLEGRCDSAVSRLVDMKINFMALDFDLTIIDEHTGGRWKGSSKELAEHVRPVFKALIESAMSHGISIAVVTFSGQTRIISEVLKSTFPDSPADIPIRGGFDPANGKQKHLALATEDVEKILSQKGISSAISGATTVLIDDDGRNIRKARQNGFHGVHFNPDDPISLLQDIMEL